MSTALLELANKLLDLLKDHKWLLIPLNYIVFCVSLVLVLTGKLPPMYAVAGYGTALFTGLCGVFILYWNWVRNSSVDSYFRTMTIDEQRIIDSLRTDSPTIRDYPHAPHIGGLLKEGIIETLKDTLPPRSGILAFGLSKRAKNRILKNYPVKIV